jgi:anti-sigma B factor antagonist
MEVLEIIKGAVKVLRPRGPLVAGDAEQFKRIALEASSANLGRIVVDTSAVPYIDSRGLEVLAEVSDELSGSGLTLKLCGTNETVREVLDLTELSGLFEHYEDDNAAVRSFL